MSPSGVLSRLSRRAWILTGVGVLAVAAAAVWIFGFVWPAQAQPSAETVTQTATASLETMQQTVATSGTVAPTVSEGVSFAVSGVVTSVNVAAGDVVAEGDVLATVDPLDLNADVLDARASLAEAQATLASAEDADDGSTATTARVSAAAAAVEVQQAAVTEAEAALEDATLRAPAAGLITAVNVTVGDKLSGSSGAAAGGASAGGAASAAAFSLVSTDSWSVTASVGETDVASVQAGLQVELTSADGDAYFGTVSEVGILPSTTSGSAQYPVTIDITGTGDGLYDGVSVDAEIIVQRRTDVLTVPSAAVTTADGASTVTLVDADGNQSDVDVTVGETAGSLSEILSGLSEGDTVLVAEFTPGEGNSGTFPGGGTFPDGDFPGGGELPDGFQPGGGSGGFPGGGGQGGGQGGAGQGGGQ